MVNLTLCPLGQSPSVERSLWRNYYHAAAEQTGRVPLDRALGLWEGYSPGVLRLVCRAAARFPFETAAAELQAYCGLEVEGRQMQRIAQDLGPKVRAVQQQLPPFKHDSGPTISLCANSAVWPASLAAR